MKYKILLLLPIIFLLASCGTNSTPALHLNSTNAMFVTNFDQNSTIFIGIKNSSAHQNAIEAKLRDKFASKGFVLTNDKVSADVVILGDLISLERLERKDPNVFMNFGFGFGSFARSVSSGVGVMFGVPFDDDFYDNRTNSYTYKASFSLLIATKEKTQNTMIYVKSDENVYSPSYIMPFIEDKIVTQIFNFFY